MKKILLFLLVSFFLKIAPAQDTLYIIGQTHIIDGPSFFDSSYQRELIQSQKEIKKILSKHQFLLVGDEGLSEKKGSTVLTIDEYRNMPIYQRRYRAVPWMLYEGTLSMESVVGIEDPLLHQRIITEKEEGTYKQLQKERSLFLTTSFLEEMKKRGVSRGALIVGSSHIRRITALAKEKGVEVRIYCTSAHPEKYL